MSNRLTLLESKNFDLAPLQGGWQGGGRKLEILEVGLAEGLEQMGTTHLSLVDLALTVGSDVLSAVDGQPIQDAGFHGALQ